MKIRDAVFAVLWAVVAVSMAADHAITWAAVAAVLSVLNIIDYAKRD